LVVLLLLCEFVLLVSNQQPTTTSEEMSDKAITLVAGNSHPQLAQAVARHLGIRLCDVEVGKFSNGETHVNIGELVREQDVYIIQTTATNPNDSLIELLIMVDALRRASAKNITAVIPCLGYARQDKKDKSRQPIAAKLVANMMERAGIDRVLTLELHTGQLQGFFNIPVDNLSAQAYLLKYIRKNIPEEKVIISPGVSSVPRAKRMADELDSDLAIIHFGRLVPGTTKDEAALTLQDMKIVGSVQDKVAILLEDIADTCEALVLMAEALMSNGAKKVYAVLLMVSCRTEL